MQSPASFYELSQNLKLNFLWGLNDLIDDHLRGQILLMVSKGPQLAKKFIPVVDQNFNLGTFDHDSQMKSMLYINDYSAHFFNFDFEVEISCDNCCY